jgi:dihydrofolate reductase
VAGTRGIIVAMSPERAIGLRGKIPWHYPLDLKRFKRLTTGATVIMGRATWESIGSKPLPGRRNIVITSRQFTGGECFKDIPSALATCTGDVWFIGGERIYAEAMSYADVIDVTHVPDRIDDPAAVRFPAIDPDTWIAGPMIEHEDDPTLRRTIYRRRTPPRTS